MVKKEKIVYLDGLRTIFCIIVIIHHFMIAFYPEAPLVFYNDGNLSVIFFMILSGLVLPLGEFSRADKIKSIKDFVSKIFFYTKKRYFRLLPVIFVTILIAYLLLLLGLYKTQDVASLYNLTEIGEYYSFKVGVTTAFFDALIGAFVRRPTLNTPLWTIKYEFWGAIVSYTMVLIFKNKNYRYLVYGFICVLWYICTRDIYFPCIVIGMMLSDCFFRVKNEKIRSKFLNNKTIMTICLMIAILAYIPAVLNIYAKYFRIVFAVAIVLFLITSQRMQEILSNEILVKISEYSYELYAVHWPVICSISCGLMIVLGKNNYYLNTTLVFVVTIIIIVILAVIMKKSINYINVLYQKKVEYIPK